MDNKNNRLFYWEVKDFMDKKPQAFESKKNSLKESITQILSENKIYRKSSFVNDPKVTEVVKNQIELISLDEKKYITEGTNKKSNSLANPFNLTEAPMSLPSEPMAGTKTSFRIGRPSLRSSIFANVQDTPLTKPEDEKEEPTGGLNTPVSVETETDTTKAKPGEPAPLVAPTVKEPTPAMGLALPIQTPGVTPSAPVEVPSPKPADGFLRTDVLVNRPPLPPSPLKAAAPGLPPGHPGTVQAGPPSPVAPSPLTTPGKPNVGQATDPGNDIAIRIAKARREANIARNKISYETDPAKKAALRDIADQRFAELRDVESDYDTWKMTASNEDLKKAKAWEGPSSFPDAGAQRDYQSNLRRMQDEYAKRIKDSKNAPKIYADAAKKKAEEEARKNPAERAKRMKMAEALAKNMGMTVEELLKTSEFFRSEYGYLFQK